MTKNIVVCCDGTGNEIGKTISNVLKLYRILEKSDRQRVHYNPGVGTIGQQNAWQRFRQEARGVFGLATGYGLDDDVLISYRFLCAVYEDGDKVWLFGFSRGAYTVRVLAAFIHVIGLLPPDQINLAGYALSAYKNSNTDGRRADRNLQGIDDRDATRSPALEAAWHFSRVAGGRSIQVEFLGVWDTVASIIVPRQDGLLFYLQTLRFTRTNPSVKIVRQAISIDERRRMFRLNRWTEPQKFLPNPFDSASEIDQDIRQVWFAGVHGDIGGGYPETESGLSKYPLFWMVEEARAKGLHVNTAMVNHLVLGRPRKGSRHQYVKPDAKARLHHSLSAAWKILEYLPKKAKWRDWPSRPALLGWYLPLGEPRSIPENAVLHRSVLLRRETMPGYEPVNLPSKYTIDETFPTDIG